MPMRFNRNRMNKGLSISTTMAMLVSLFTGTIVTAGTASAANTTYYVSAAGSDSNNGTSSTTPWKTLSKVSGAAFGAGDKILFRSGDSWSGQLLINDSGASGNPVTVGAYNTGSKPLINGGGNSAAILIDGASYVTVDGVAVTNYDGANVTDGVEGNRDGIKINGASSNITIRNNEIYNVEGFSNHSATGSPRGTSLDASANNMYMVGAIYQTGTPANNYLIENNYIHDNTVNGVLTTQVGTGLVIRSNTVNNGGADGIEYWNATSPLIEYNSVTNIGNNSGASAQTAGVIGYHGYAVAGIWGIVDTDQVVQYNYVANTNRIVWDGQAWDFDNQTVRGVYQYNFSRDNEGGFVLGGNTDQILRYNISYNDGSQQAYADQGFFNANSQYYNNVFYQNNGAGFSKSKLTAGSFKNNIFYTNASNTSYTNYQSGGPTFSNNGFGGTQSALNKGTASVTGDPLFVNPSSVGTSITSVDGFKLQSGSPMIDAGTSIASNGGKDYWGNTLYNGSPDIGAYEAPTGGTTPPPSGSDTHGGTWALKQLSTGTASGTGAYQTVSGVAASSTYVYNAWVKGAGQQGKLVVYDSSWNVLAESSIYTSTGTWTQVSTPSFSTGTNTSLNVQFIDTGTTAGTTYIDDAFLGISGGANKLTNAGFESGSTGWTMAAPYTIVQPPAPSNTHGGTWALKQLNTGTASGTGAYQAPTSIATSSTYVFKAWVRGAGQQGKLVVYDNSWNVIAESASYTASSTWTEISTPSFSTGTNTTLRVQFVDLGTTAGTTYLDDAFLGISGGTNKLTNPGFESGNTGWTMTGPYTIVQP
ncbi:right-handed parallel beta-helix repeat-containing protein [Paenibacillus rhizovicinus]|uniref:Right-handed parallel beta-helix repeat-containing protein n=1 Tax=Paenibacillus rhizovicinus TaxID=2704463 RepID=A0A6C0P4M4_9BACL|nr:right-handed parallel beta-helix repeat-containing protein [Paenibacillus rhizovicinus]QHW33494.1 right-handed parallel beta-helix repeat-containing protein [Paenibacillus rhizovicinus]